MDLAVLQRRQDKTFGVNRPVIASPLAAERYLERVGIALRYQANPGLPLPSLLRTFVGDDPHDKAAMRKGLALTNHLLQRSVGIEVHVIADRVAVVHRSLVPPLYALVRRGRDVDDLIGLSMNARAALALIRQRKDVTMGDVRAHLGLVAVPRHDPAYLALSELTRIMLVDRGPFDVPKTGIPYLPQEGYPYHVFHDAHADLVAASRRYSIDAAADAWLAGYLKAAAFGRVRKLVSMFKLFLSQAEIEASLARLVDKRKLTAEKLGSQRSFVWNG